ncbi:putative transposase [Rickettsia endosymbiont of Ixodes pacificus]|nr:putative transposase [Rickettsia endosymbiont of Ixodes pacificus]
MTSLAQHWKEEGVQQGMQIGEARGMQIGEARGMQIGEAKGKYEVAKICFLLVLIFLLSLKLQDFYF